MDSNKKEKRYKRIFDQIEGLIKDNPWLEASLATIAAILYHKMEYYFWTGFYLLRDGELIVGPYQGPLACIKLQKDTGVCWAGINQNKTLIVPDVHQFPDHIACDSRSRSEIVVPLKNLKNEIIGVLDVDSNHLDSFDDVDARWLEEILSLTVKRN